MDKAGRGFAWTHLPDQLNPESRNRLDAVMIGVVALLRCEGRVTYRLLQQMFAIDDAALAVVRDELCFRRLARDEGQGLVWIGEAPASHSLLANPLESSPVQVAESAEPGAHPSEVERRQLTVMFCDLVGSTELSSRLDPEDLRDVIRLYQERAAVAIQAYDGHIAQYLGDGLLVYFGYPIAHGDDAERAVHAGLGIVDSMLSLNQGLASNFGIQLEVRIGLHTGPVVIGEMGGVGYRESLALGETPNIAARIEGVAAPNSVVMSSVTAQLVSLAFDLEEMGTHHLKGLPDAIALLRVRGVADADRHDRKGRPQLSTCSWGVMKKSAYCVGTGTSSRKGLGMSSS